ncbi:MAG: CDP-alcohol phosphatidyltransferase family protein [Rickettsiales bacterium]|jgi:CDP-diacylglycerol--glycerol-3-phosphate 3-phosphatidyltransferase|nr:CDP-alcohol phosphatidyltransferase family protein [Rickettsiales bacterium]
MKLNIPTGLIFFRILCIPFFLGLFWIGANYAAALLFAAASLSDLFDGIIARRTGNFNTFVKFADPLADKMLICCALVALCGAGLVPAWFVILIICRDFLITGFRMFAAANGKVLGAVITGKLNTALQMIFIPCILIGVSTFIQTGLLWLIVIMTIVSTTENFIRNKSIAKQIF